MYSVDNRYVILCILCKIHVFPQRFSPSLSQFCHPSPEQKKDCEYYKVYIPRVCVAWNSISPTKESSLYRLALRSSPQHLSDMNLKQSGLKNYHIPLFRSSLQFFPFSINNVEFDGGPDPGLASRRPPGQLFNLQVSLKFPVLRPISAKFGHLGSGPRHTTTSSRA